MVQISQLTSVPSVTGSEQIPVASRDMGVDAKMSVAQLLAYIEAQFADPNFTTIYFAPSTTGQTQTLGAQTTNVRDIITPTGPFAALTIVLPPVASCFDGQQIIVTCAQAITVLTITGNGATVAGAPNALATAGFFALRYDALLTTWFCVAQSLGSPSSTFTNIVADTIQLNSITASVKDANGNTVLSVAAGDALAVNFVRIVNRETSSKPQITVEGADANIGMTITTKGTGSLEVTAGTDVDITATAGNAGLVALAGSATVQGGSAATLVSTAGNANVFGAGDANVDAAAGDVNLTATGSVRAQNDVVVTLTAPQTMSDKSLTFPIVVAVLSSQLPTPGVGNVGMRATVTDGLQTVAANIGAVLAGTGAVVLPVYSDGVAWRIG